MKNGTLTLFWVCLVAAVITACDNSKQITMWTNSYKMDCAAGAGKMKCLQVYKGTDLASAEWENFYSNIEGFEFEEGYYQQIEVKEEPRKGEVPADASSLSYTLVKVLAKQKDERFALSGKWGVKTINGELVETADAPVFLEIEVAKMKAAGNDSCNNYTGPITSLTDDTITFGNLASTKKMCPDMSVADLYYQALTNTTTYELKENVLVFRDADGAETVSFGKE